MIGKCILLLPVFYSLLPYHPPRVDRRGSSFLWLWRPLTLPRFLHLHLSWVVLHQGSSLEEGALYLIGCLTLLTGTDEVYSQTGDISGDGEVLGLVSAYGLETDFESAEAIELHGEGVLELVGHHLYKLIDHGKYVRLLDGTVALDDVCQSIGIHSLDLHCTTVIEVS